MDTQQQVSVWRINGKKPGWVARQLEEQGVPPDRILVLVREAYGEEYEATRSSRGASRAVGILLLISGLALNIWTMFGQEGSVIVSAAFIGILIAGVFITILPDSLGSIMTALYDRQKAPRDR